uniref:Upstream stimulatory factor 1 n=1 Tax=Denticeps clupeoides TaxID=299321 RepID=A0AAY4DXT8_9TELE
FKGQRMCVLLEGAVATADDPSAITTIQSAATFSTDQPIKYLFKTEGTGGQVTYRVIHVTDGQVDGQPDGAAAVGVVTGFPNATHAVTPAVTQVTIFTREHVCSRSVPLMGRRSVVPCLTFGLLSSGQLYVMMSPQDVLGTASQRYAFSQHLASFVKTESPRTSRDDKRRAQHNEVERRRRDKINNWIVQLSKTIPDCNMDTTKNGQSKGGILSKACDYIQELVQSNGRLADELETLERLRMDNQLLRQEAEEWKSKNQMLRSQMRQHGIVAASTEPQ